MEIQQHIPKKKKKSKAKSKQRVFTKKYVDESVEKLKRLIKNYNERGNERFYAIKVDNEFCVSKTSNPKYFDDYKEFIDGTTESMEVTIYFGNSNNCNRHIFYLKENTLGNVEPNVDKKISEALRKRDQEHLIESLKNQVEQQEEYIQQLEEELEKIAEESKSKTDIQGILKEGTALLGAIKGLPNINNSKTLSGTDNKTDTKVEVESMETSEEQDEEEEEKSAYNEAFNEIYDQFGKDGVKQIVGLMIRISNSEKLREEINDLIKNDNQNNKEKQNKSS